MRPIVAIKIPTLGSVNAGILVFTNALMAMKDLPFEFEVDVVLGYRPHDYARNKAIQSVFDNERIAKVWFIDSDVVPNPRCAKLLTVHADIAVGPYCVTKREKGVIQPQSSLYRVEDDVWRALDTTEEGQLEVDAAGMGMMVIDRKVITDLRMRINNDHSAYIGKKPNIERVLFRHRYNPDGSLALGEDMDFCRRARRLGYRIVADTSVRVGHLKEIDLEEFRKALLVPVPA